jgi:ABC-2 type transport system permease protein
MNALTKIVAIARVNLVRTLRDKTGFFFIFVLPFILIAALGIQFGSSTLARLGLVASPDDPLARALVVALEAGDLPFEVRRTTDEAAVRSAVERGSLEAGLVLPGDYAEALRGDGTVEVVFLGTPESTTGGLRQAVEAALGAQAVLVIGARAGEDYGGVSFDDALAIARDGVTAVPGVTLVVEQVGGEPWYAGYGQFTLAAHTQLVLFVFMTSMTAAAQLVMSKQLGVSRRMLATATSPGTVIAGETLGRFGVAMLQAVVIVAMSALAFGVDWGDPLAALALVVTFSLVSAAVAMLVGAMSRDAEQAGSIGVFASLALAALGGCMIPLQFMPEVMQQLALLTPHAWAVLGFKALITEDADLVGVLPQVIVLLGYGTVVLMLATWRFRRAISG